jgi:hypothetical protein
MTFFHALISLFDIESSLSERRRDARAVDWRQLAPDSLVLAVGFGQGAFKAPLSEGPAAYEQVARGDAKGRLALVP